MPPGVVDPVRHLDDRVLRGVNAVARRTGWLHPLMTGYARFGLALFVLLLLAGLLTARRRRSRTLAAAVWACLAPLVAVAVNQPVGRSVAEARPYATHPHLLVLASRTSDFSFPSDHAVMAGAVAAGLALVSRRLGLLAAGAAALMAFARVYIAAHYPWDVVAGLVLGAAVTLLGWLLLRRPLTAGTDFLRRRRPFRALLGETPAEPATAPSAVRTGASAPAAS